MSFLLLNTLEVTQTRMATTWTHLAQIANANSTRKETAQFSVAALIPHTVFNILTILAAI